MKLSLLYTLIGLVLACSILALALVFIVTGSTLKSYDMNQKQVAHSLGPPRWKAFVKVTLPQISFAP